MKMLQLKFNRTSVNLCQIRLHLIHRKLPIPAKPVSAVNPHKLIGNHSFLSDSQLPIDISITKIVVRSDTNTPLARCGITNQQLSYLIDEYIQLINRGLLKTHANKKSRAKASSFGFDTMDIVVVFSIEKNWFYSMSQPKKYWTDQHIDVIFYYLSKKSKLRSMNQYKCTSVNCLFNTHIHNTHERYYNTEADDDISTKNTLTVRRLYHERSITNIMK
ncbi:hypothetical protein KY285_000466 [Solanum tuberosum]|nr:hypothetical protein KY285_000466 [Solanum tuberosum]